MSDPYAGFASPVEAPPAAPAGADPYADVGAHPILAHDITGKNGRVYRVLLNSEDQRGQVEQAINARIDAGDADLKGKLDLPFPAEVHHPAPPVPPPPQPGIPETLARSTVEDVGRVAQGVAQVGDLIATGAGKVISAIPTVAGWQLDMMGNHQGAENARGVARQLAHPFSLSDAMDRYIPRSPGAAGAVNQVVGNFTGGALAVPGAAVENIVGRAVGELPKGYLRPRSAGSRVYDAASRLGMENDLLPADVGGTGTKMATSVSAMTLGGIPLAEQSTKGVNSLARIADATAASAGAVRDPTGAGLAAQSGARSFMTASENRASQLYDAIPIAGERPASLSNTRSALANLTAGLKSNPELSALITDPRLVKFEAAIGGRAEQVPTGVLDASGNPIMRTIQRGGQLSWQDLKAFRTYVGEKAGAPALQSDTSQKALKALYGSLSQDMAATASAEGPGALRAFNRANQFWRGRQDRIENVLNTVLGNDLNKGGMAAYEGIGRLAAAKGGDPIKLGRLMRSLSTDEADSVRATIIQRMGMAKPANQSAAHDVFSPAEFMTKWNSLDPRAKATLFNKGDLRSALDDLAEVSGGMKAAGKYANTSKTSLAVNGAILLTKFFHNIPAGLATAAGEYAVGAALSSPVMVRALVRIGRTSSPAATKAAIGRLSAIGAANVHLRETASSLQGALNALNDNMATVTSSAASPSGTNTQGEQQ